MVERQSPLAGTPEPARDDPELDELVARSLRDDLLVMHLQPRVRVLDRAVVGFEALMRLRTGAGALLNPGDFLPRAAAMGILGDLERKAVRMVCAQTAEWSASGYRLQASLNLSADRVADAVGFEPELRAAFAETGLAPRQLIVELPRTVVEEITPEFVRGLSTLKRLGVVLSLEDFGDGSVAIEQLAGLGFTEIKLDRRLIAAVPADGTVCSLLRTYATQSRAFGLRCVAAGVETSQQNAFLVGAGIELAQGYYYERPLPVDSFAELVKVPAGVVEERR